ncbi:hypothetical protein YTPLAS18_01940 [Nitrospira sp.]|nr:hypothetical protein YTPLAS18_01940 [Nitrospira sp.]
MPRPVVIDTDPGVDDALAILLALRSPELQVVGMTTVSGNVSLRLATRNVFHVLSLARATNIPVGVGAARPLKRNLVSATHVHGREGLGELDRFTDADGLPRYHMVRVPRRLPTALEVWEQCVNQNPRHLMLIMLGPLTNLARALESRPSVVRRFRSIIAMAGAIAVPGNVTPSAEFNVYVDPEAAARVVRARLPLTLVPLDVTTQVAMTRAQIIRRTARTSDPVCRFFGDATERALDFAERVEGRPVFPFHDPLAVATAIDPSLVRCASLHISVETQSDLMRGTTLADRRIRSRAERTPTNVRVAMRVDVRRSLGLIKERLCRRCS